MALSTLSFSRKQGRVKISNPKMERVSLEGYTLSYVSCRSDNLCRFEEIAVKFDPPLNNAREIK